MKPENKKLWQTIGMWAMVMILLGILGICTADAQEVIKTETQDSVTFQMLPYDYQQSVTVHVSGWKFSFAKPTVTPPDTTEPEEPDVPEPPDSVEIVYGRIVMSYEVAGACPPNPVWVLYINIRNETLNTPVNHLNVLGITEKVYPFGAPINVPQLPDMGNDADGITVPFYDVNIINGLRKRDYLRWGVNSVTPPGDLKIRFDWAGKVYEYNFQAGVAYIDLPELADAQEPNKFGVTVRWNPNSELDLAGYKVYWGTTSRVYTQNFDVGNRTQWDISNLSMGLTYYFAVTAYDLAGNESIYSVEVSIE